MSNTESSKSLLRGSIVTVNREPSSRVQQPQRVAVPSKTRTRLFKQVAMKGARKAMMRRLDEITADTVSATSSLLGRAVEVAQPQVNAITDLALSTAGTVAEQIAVRLLHLSKAARKATLKNMPRKEVQQLVLELANRKAAGLPLPAPPDNATKAASESAPTPRGR
jgi:hypothetical protein